LNRRVTFRRSSTFTREHEQYGDDLQGECRLERQAP
jgi:hypothetical protein